MIEWLNQNAGAVQALATVVLVAITACYAFLTFRLVAVTDRQFQLNARLAELDASQGEVDTTRIAGALLRDAENALRRFHGDLRAKMFSAEWRHQRDELELTAVAVGGAVAAEARAAVTALREWEQLVRRAERSGPTELHDDAEEQLRTAVTALRRLSSTRKP